MRVVHVVTAFPRHADDPITPWLVELVRRQRDEGLDASVFAPAYRGGPSAPAGSLERFAGIPVRRFRYAPAALETLTHDETVPDRLRRAPWQALLLPPYLLAGILAARRLGARERPDVVHVHWPMPHALFGAALRSGSGRRSAVVCSYYSVEIHWIRSKLPFLVPFLRWTARTADAVTAISSSTAAAVRELVERPVAKIPYGAATADGSGEATAERAALAPPTGDRPVRILFVGRLVERKGVEVLVRAVALGAGADDGVRFARPVELRIVGAGEWEPRIRDAVGAAGLPVTEAGDAEPRGAADARVVFLGRLSDAALRREYAEADVFVLPAVRDAKGDTEGLGVVLLEALRFERPVIGSEIGGIPDIVRHEQTGLLVPPGDPAALARALARLIDDPAAARELGRRGRAYATDAFGWEGVVRATTGAYEEAMRARAAGR